MAAVWEEGVGPRPGVDTEGSGWLWWAGMTHGSKLD